MAFSPQLLSSGIGDIGGAVGDLFSAVGDQAEANSYGEAATYAAQYAKIAASTGQIQQAQTRRQVYSSESATQAVSAGNGLRMSGSAANVLRSSAQQGALQVGLVGEQTQVNVNADLQQENAYAGEQQAAENAKSGAEAGGLLSAVSGIASIAGMF